MGLEGRISATGNVEFTGPYSPNEIGIGKQKKDPASVVQ
jgi:hypothetical protein